MSKCDKRILKGSVLNGQLKFAACHAKGGLSKPPNNPVDIMFMFFSFVD